MRTLVINILTTGTRTTFNTAKLSGSRQSSRVSLQQGSFSYNAEDVNHPLHEEHGSTEQLIQNQSNIASFYTPQDNVRTLPTVWVILIQIMVLVTFEVMSFVTHDVLHTELLGGLDPPFALLSAIHVGVWLAVVIVDRYVQYHHRVLRKYGYLSLYTKTKDLRRLPLWIISLGNAVLLVVASALGNRPNWKPLSLTRIFQVIVSVEVFVAILATSVYLVKVIQFNKSGSLPDAFNQDIVPGFNSEMYASPEIGYRDQECLDDVLEKQAEMIRYLQQHNSNLGRRIVELTQNGKSTCRRT